MSVADILGDSNYFVYGFHGTDEVGAAAIRASGYYQPSDNFTSVPDEVGGDWLGGGFYFWQDAPQRVWEWLAGRESSATRPLAPPHEVLIARVRLTRCLDLLDTRWHAAIREAYAAYRDGLASGEAPAVNRGSRTRANWHRLDDAILRLAVESAASRLRPFSSVRGAFEEGDRIFPGSALYDRTHIELAVINESVIEVERWDTAPANQIS